MVPETRYLQLKADFYTKPNLDNGFLRIGVELFIYHLGQNFTTHIHLKIHVYNVPRNQYANINII